MNTYIKTPSTIQSFNNTESKIETAVTGRQVYVLEGEIEIRIQSTVLTATETCTFIHGKKEL